MSQAAVRLFSTALASILASAATLSAQQTMALHGVVADESSWQPVSSARVTLVETGAETVTGRLGTFVFPAAPLGQVSIRVEAAGFPVMVQEVEVTADATVFLEFVLPNVHEVLDEILVLAGRSHPPESSEPRSAADLIAMQVRGMLANSGTVGDDRSGILLRGVSSISLQGDPVVYLDGVRMSGGPGEALHALSSIPASDVREIRVLRGPTASFLRGSADGVIEVWTKSGPSR